MWVGVKGAFWGNGVGIKVILVPVLLKKLVKERM
jgi:hypothetical protein